MADVFGTLHPIVAGWCREHLVEPTMPQREALPLGVKLRTFLLSSPTGTGKTLAAFLPLMSRLAERRDADELLPRTYGLYVSPLRALSYDVEHNLRVPLREMGLLERPNSERAKLRRGRIRESVVRTAVRTSDTPLEERRLMLRRPPHLLLTTPESLAVMLAMDSYRKALRFVETVVVDEVHALGGNKRGAQLSLLLESLEELVAAPFNRIGLSATASPLERIAEFLAGVGRACEIVDARGLRSVQVRVDAPFEGAMAPLATVARAASDLTREVRSALVFTNVRSQAELIGHEMAQLEEVPEHVEIAGDVPRRREGTRIGVHHSALERNVRHRIEAALRDGKLHTVVCSSSLELGVDIGFMDRVIIVGGARGITATLQRIGRSGHRPNAIADGVVIAQDRDDIIEAAATKRCIADGTIEAIEIPAAPLDVLAQWLVGSVVPRRRAQVNDLLRIARRAYPFRELEESDLRACARYLSGQGVGSERAHVRRIGYDGHALYGLGRDVSAAFFENVGTIPDEAQTVVRAREGTDIGRVEEAFRDQLHVGDVLLLAGRTFEIKEVRRGGVVVEPVSAKPTVPQWSSHLRGISKPLALEIDRLRSGVAQRLTSTSAAREWLQRRYGLREWEARHVVGYLAQQAAISAIPQLQEPIVEIYRMSGRQTAVFHTGAGRRINETLGRAVGARLFRFARTNTQLTTDDGGFMLTLPRGKTIPDAVWASMLHVEHFERDLLEGLQSSHLIKTNFRYVANTGLLVLRRAGGRALRRRALSWNAAEILGRVKNADPDFVLLRETIRTVTRDLLDAPGALEYLNALKGEPRVLHPPAASPFTFGIVTSSFGDSIVLEERTTMVEALHERVLALRPRSGQALAQ